MIDWSNKLKSPLPLNFPQGIQFTSLSSGNNNHNNNHNHNNNNHNNHNNNTYIISDKGWLFNAINTIH